MADPNVAGSFVKQDSGYWSQVIPPDVSNADIISAGKGIYGAGSKLVSGIKNVGKNPIKSILGIGTVYGQLQRGFPNTFQNPQQNPTMEAINSYGGAASQYAGIGLTGLSGIQNVAQGNVGLGLTDLSSVYNQLRPTTGFGQIPGYINAPINAFTLFQSAQKGDYANVGIAGANLYNNAVDSGLLKTGSIAPDYIGGGAGVLNLGLGLANKNYGQAFYGGAQVAESGYNLLSGGASSGAEGAGFLNAGINQGGEGIAGSGIGGGGPLGLVAAGVGATLGARNIIRSNGDNASKIAATNRLIGDTAANYYTAGLSGLAQAGLAKFAPNVSKKIDQVRNIEQFVNPMTAPFAIASKIPFINKLGASGKGEFQQTRDSYRSAVINSGSKLFGKDYQGTLADGSTFDFGKDGSTLKLDFKDPLVGRAAALGDAFATAQGATGKAREAIATLFAKAATSNAKTENDVNANFKHFFSQAGITGDQAQAAINIAYDQKKLSKDQYKVASSSISQVNPSSNVNQLPDDFEPSGGKTSGNSDAAKNDKRVIPTTVQDYVKQNGIKPGQQFRIPGDPNSYTVDDKGAVTGTLIGGGKPDFTKPPDFSKPSTPGYALALPNKALSKTDLTKAALTDRRVPIDFAAAARNDQRVLHPAINKALAMRAVFGRGGNFLGRS